MQPQESSLVDLKKSQRRGRTRLISADYTVPNSVTDNVENPLFAPFLRMHGFPISCRNL